MEEFLLTLLTDFPRLGPVFFIILRALALIIPPIPGLLIDSVGVLIFDWPWGFIYAWIGLVVGAMVAFWIARKFRNPLIARFKILKNLSDAEHNLTRAQEFWSLILLRIFTNPLLDYVNFIAGFTRVSGWKFFITTIIGYFPYAFVVYFFGGYIIQHTGVQIVGVLVSVLIVLFIYKKYSVIKK